jgi:iron complex outermembrane receptor protein
MASSAIFIRGIGQADPTSTVDPGVGLSIDEVYMGTAVGGTMDVRDIANVQVLRGPQGTLLSRNSIGGAILLTTTAPGDDFGGKLRVSFGLRKQDGHVERNFDGEDLRDANTWTTAAKLQWKPGDRFTATFNLDYTKADENGAPLVFGIINQTQTFPRVASFDAGCPGMYDF